MSFNFAALNDAMLITFGEIFSFVRVASAMEPANPDDPDTVTGILIQAREMETLAPRDGGINAGLYLKDDALDPPLAAGDEMTVGDYVYKLLAPEADEAGMLLYPLRRDRAAEPNS